MRALLSMAAAIHRELRGDGDSKHPLSPAPAPPPAANASFTHWDPAGREAIERGSKHPCPHIIDAAQLSPLRNHHRIAVSCWASQACGATLLESSSLPGHMTELFHPFNSTTTSTATAASHTNPLSFTSLPASPLRLRLLLSAEPLSCAQPHGPSQASASRAHTPRTPACTRLATLVPLTLTRPPSRCTTRCDAWLTRVVADSSSLPTDLLASLPACLLRLRNTAPTTPSVSSSANSLVTIIPFRFRATSRSQAATCASLCVASPRNAHTFTRAID